MKTAILISMLIAAISAVDIKCDFIMWDLLDLFDKFYTCFVRGITLTGDENLENVIGTHLSGKSNADVMQIHFGWNCSNLTFIPKNMHNFFPDLLGIYLRGSNVTTLVGDELKDFPNLEWFYVWSQTIERIPGNLFQFNPKMRAVNFCFNHISYVGWNSFNHLENLTTLELRVNNCVSDGVSQNRTGVLQLIKEVQEQCPDPEDPKTEDVAQREDRSYSLGDTDERNCTLEDEVKDLRTETQALRQDKDDQQKSIEGLKQENEELKVANQRLEAERKQIKDESVQMRLEIERILLEMKGFQEQLEDIRERLLKVEENQILK